MHTKKKITAVSLAKKLNLIFEKSYVNRCGQNSLTNTENQKTQ